MPKYFIQFFKSSKCLFKWEKNARDEVEALQEAMVANGIDRWTDRGPAYHIKIVCVS